jgi:hypothetical protein
MQFEPTRARGYRYFEPDDYKPTPAEYARRKAQVARELGYDPARYSRTTKHAFETIGIDAFVDSGNLKTPPAPASDRLKELIVSQGGPCAEAIIAAIAAGKTV